MVLFTGRNGNLPCKMVSRKDVEYPLIMLQRYITFTTFVKKWGGDRFYCFLDGVIIEV